MPDIDTMVLVPGDPLLSSITRFGYDIELILDHRAQQRYLRITTGEESDAVKIGAMEWYRLQSVDQAVAQAAAAKLMKRAEEALDPLLERRQRKMFRFARRIRSDVEAMLDEIATARNEMTGVAYFRHWCPNCESSTKLYRPRPLICRDPAWDSHPPTIMRIKAVFEADLR